MVLILGAGYVGSALARLLKSNYPVRVTTRSKEKKALLEQEFTTLLLDTTDVDALRAALLNEEILIVTVAASSSANYKETYLNTALNIKKAASSSLKQIIYTSSTSVYGDAHGAIVTEESPTLNTSEQGKILLETENTFLSLQSNQTDVLIFRLTEIYGPSRTLIERVKRLIGKKAPGDGSQLAHLIHLDDIIQAILFGLKHHLKGIYNLCDDERISRKELYDKVSRNYHLPLVEWDSTLTSIHRSGSKQVSNQKIKDVGFKLLHPNIEIFK